MGGRGGAGGGTSATKNNIRTVQGFLSALGFLQKKAMSLNFRKILSGLKTQARRTLF